MESLGDLKRLDVNRIELHLVWRRIELERYWFWRRAGWERGSAGCGSGLRLFNVS